MVSPDSAQLDFFKTGLLFNITKNDLQDSLEIVQQIDIVFALWFILEDFFLFFIHST